MGVPARGIKCRLEVVEEDSALSFVRSDPFQSFLDIRNGLAGDEQSVTLSLQSDDERIGTSLGFPQTSRVFEGATYRLVISK